eukprot:jgi/Tetstr1/456681/TSEL_043382.t1
MRVEVMTTQIFITKNVDAAAEIHDISLQHYGESTFNKAISGNLKIPSPAEEASSISAACNEGLPDCEGKALDEQLIQRLLAFASLVTHVKKLSASGAPNVWQLAVGEAERRAAERAMVDNMKETNVSVLALSQLGAGISAGDSLLIHGVRLIAEKQKPHCSHAVTVHTDLRNAYKQAWRRTIIQRHIDCSPLHPVIPALMASLSTDAFLHASVGLEVSFDKMHAYNADMDSTRREAPAEIEWPELDYHHGIRVLNVPFGSQG